MLLINGTVGKDNVVVSFVDAVLSLMAEILQCLVKSFLALANFEDDRQLDSVESLISDVTKNI